MKIKKLFIAILTGLFICCMSATLFTACELPHTHSFTEDSPQTCTKCGYTVPEKAEIKFNNSNLK